MLRRFNNIPLEKQETIEKEARDFFKMGKCLDYLHPAVQLEISPAQVKRIIDYEYVVYKTSFLRSNFTKSSWDKILKNTLPVGFAKWAFTVPGFWPVIGCVKSLKDFVGVLGITAACECNSYEVLQFNAASAYSLYEVLVGFFPLLDLIDLCNRHGYTSIEFPCFIDLAEALYGKYTERVTDSLFKDVRGLNVRCRVTENTDHTK